MKKSFRWLFFALFFQCFLFNSAQAYIDPGTGSMLFSVILGCSTTLFFIFMSLRIKLKRLLFSKKDLSQNSIPFVIYSEGNQYFSVFKPILDEFEKRKITVHYYTSDEKDYILNSKYTFVKPEFIGKVMKAYIKLAFLKADVCLMTTPQLDVLQLKRSKYVKRYAHIFHGITTSMDYRLFSLDYYDSVLCDAEFQIDLIRELETKRNLPKKECYVIGSTYMDYLELKKNTLNKLPHPFTVLIAPSWGEDGLLSKFGSTLIDNLLNENYNLIIRPHPQSRIVENELLKKLEEKYKDNKNLSWDYNPDNLETLNKADVLISDFSCVMFDFAFLFNKPFIYSISSMNKEIYDMSDLDETPLRYKIMEKIGKELTTENINDIKSTILELKDNPKIIEEIQTAKDLSWMQRGVSAQRAVDYLINKQKEVSKC